MLANIYRCEYGDIEIIPVNMDEVRTVRKDWENRHPPPEPPTVPPPYYREYAKEMLAIKKKNNLSRREAIDEWRGRQEQVPNYTDDDYIRKRSLWEYAGFISAANFIVQESCVLNDKSRAVLKKIDHKQLSDLIRKIASISELTKDLVIQKIQEFNYQWKGKDILYWYDNGHIPKGEASSSWLTMGAVAAQEVENMGPYKFKQLDIEEQAEILAIYLVRSWVDTLVAQEERNKREQQQRQQQFSRGNPNTSAYI